MNQLAATLKLRRLERRIEEVETRAKEYRTARDTWKAAAILCALIDLGLFAALVSAWRGQ